MAKNRFMGAGRITRSFEHSSTNGRTFYNVSVAFPDPGRTREDGTPFTYNIPVNVSGPLADRIGAKLQEGAKVLVEGSFEPSQKDGKRFYSVNANDFAFMDAGTMNHIVVQGRLTRDPEMRTTQSGTGVASASVAVDRNYRDKAGEWQTVTSFIDVTAWRSVADQLAPFKKGDAVWIVGKLTSRKYTDRNGTDHYPVEITADTVLSGGTGRYNQTGAAPADTGKASGPAPAPAAGGDDGFFDGFGEYDEELPFD